MCDRDCKLSVAGCVGMLPGPGPAPCSEPWRCCDRSTAGSGGQRGTAGSCVMHSDPIIATCHTVQAIIRVTSHCVALPYWLVPLSTLHCIMDSSCLENIKFASQCFNLFIFIEYNIWVLFLVVHFFPIRRQHYISSSSCRSAAWNLLWLVMKNIWFGRNGHWITP